MTDLVDLPLTLGPSPLSEAREPRSAAVAGRPFTTEASRWSRGLLQAEQTVCEALAALPEVSSMLAEPGPCHGSALRLRATERASRRLVAAWVCGVLLGDLDRGSSLLDAERWFAGTASAAVGMPVGESKRVQAILAELVGREGARCVRQGVEVGVAQAALALPAAGMLWGAVTEQVCPGKDSR